MSLNIDKKEMDQSWHDKDVSPKFYDYCYKIAAHQVARKGINIHEREDFIQFAVMKCYKHQDAYNPNRSSTYSFFWKQISLAIIYMQRKQARKKNKINTFYVEQEKILDWAEQNQHKDDGESLKDIVDEHELKALKDAFKKYNKAHSRKLKPSKENAIKVVKWMNKKEPMFLEKFTTLKPVLKNWLASSGSYNKVTN
jgi:DNA-directed RNA polymerase specialized sigma24 family protein